MIARAALRLQSDSRLSELAAAGHEPAFEAIVVRYRSALLRYCARLLPADRAEDAVQQTFVNAFTALRSEEPPARLKPWLYRIAHNVAVNALHKNGWDYDQLREELNGVPQPPDIVMERARLRDVLRELDRLPERQRSALVLRAFEGRSYEEIASALRATAPIVRQLLNRARTKLRDGLGFLVPVPVLRAMLSGGFAKAGIGVLAATTIAAGTGVAVHDQSGARHAPSDHPHTAKLRSRETPPTRPAQVAGKTTAHAPRHSVEAGRSRERSAGGRQGADDGTLERHRASSPEDSGDDHSGSSDDHGDDSVATTSPLEEPDHSATAEPSETGGGGDVSDGAETSDSTGETIGTETTGSDDHGGDTHVEPSSSDGA
jgi:RNA polymerase sigma factor (sigma-70 family)